MALEKIINARFAQKIDSYANWTDETLGEGKGALCVLKHGEIGFCEIPSGSASATTAPTILFKVGDGTSPFKSLKWASALAADVYGWAKAETVELINEKLTFKNKDGSIAKEVDLSTFATDAKVEELLAGYYTKTEIDGKVEAINEAIENLEVGALKDRVDNIENVTIPTLATKEEVADEVEALEGAIADVDAKFAGYYTKTEVDAAHNLKADKTQVATDIETAVNAEKDRAMGVEAGLRTDVDAAATKEYVDAELAKKQDNIPENTYDAYGAAADVKDYADETFATKVALAAEVERATGVEGGLRTDVDAVTARVNTFFEGTGAADVIDTLEDIVNYINTHEDVDVPVILADIQALKNKTVLGTYVDDEETKEYATVKAYVEAVVAALEKKITDAEGGYAAADAALKTELQKEIDDDVAAEAALRDAADVELGKRINAEAKTREDADKALGERIDTIVDEETGVLAVAKKYTDDEIIALALGDMSKETAADYVKKVDAPGFEDILTKTEGAATYRTEAQVNTQIDAKIPALATAVQNVAAVAGNGIKVTREGNNVSLDWDTDVVFVFNAGTSTTVI